MKESTSARLRSTENRPSGYENFLILRLWKALTTTYKANIYVFIVDILADIHQEKTNPCLTVSK